MRWRPVGSHSADLRCTSSDHRFLRQSNRRFAGAALIMLGLWGIAVWVGSSVKYATVFAAILIGSLLVLGALGGILLRALRRVSRHHLIRRSAVLRHGIANLYRPGAHAAAIL